ncbi:uncharacterized protein TRIVIDRAFT_30862 [Trichoderma virens Gv29-8]|uniref:Uncharacterized protein n=1 Tax=Hypocrea virens (strain Gv29-8 / FGSC 10586) TaxID=413071 RepID=G9MMA0_HYPVG|nr:uncharacterized protein TRIVIDRAFT_30862 [Trichoderma virens Gv29-8]EHK24469.1 hypothetical protein TRIVIDRAFT_30862 [Trichoderma virens Gv29-8]
MPPKAASASTPGSATKSSGTWDNVEFLNDLLVAFYQVGNQAGSFNQQSNAAIVEFLTAQGHETSWKYPTTPSSYLLFIMGAPKSADATLSGNKPTRGWDAAAHEALLLCVIDEVKGGKAFLTEVTRKMQARGYTYSYDAINQHVQKLRKNRDTTGLATTADSGAGSAKGATPRKTATPRKRRTPKKEIVADDDDDMNLKLEEAIEDEEMRSPSIRPSKRAKSVAS